MSGIKHRKHASRHRPVAFSTLVGGIALSLPALAASPAHGQVEGPLQHRHHQHQDRDHAGTGDPSTLPTIEVKGQRIQYKVDQVSSPKFTQPLLDTPQTISVISDEVIRQQGATTLTQALQNVPGVGTFYVGENGSTSTGDAIYMRGFNSSGSIFVDGVRDLGAISRDTFNIQQIEVTQGPDGTEYGRTAPSGAINLVSKQPMPGSLQAASLSYGSDNQKRTTADWNKMLGEHGAFRLNVMGQDSGVPGRHDIENNRWGIAPSLAFGLGTPTRVYLDLLHITQNNVPDGGVSTIGLPGYSTPDPTRPFLDDAPPVNPSNFYGTDADYDHVKSDMATLIVQHDFSGNASLQDTLRWGRTWQNYMLTSFKSDASGLSTPNPDDPSTWTIARSNPNLLDQTNRIITNQFNFTDNVDTGTVSHAISAGVELTREEIATGGLAVLDGSAWTPANLYDPDPDTATGLVIGDNGTWSTGRTDTAAAYLFDTLKFGQHWLVTAGGRIDHYDTDFRSEVLCGGRRGPDCGSLPANTPVPGVDAGRSGNLYGYKLGIVYKPVEQGSLYVNFATSAEPPGGDTLALSSSANSADNPIFDPEKSRTTEIGTKWNVLDGQLRLTTALFRTVVSNLVVQDPVDLQYYQIGHQRVQGIELDAVGQLNPYWALTAGYTVMNTSTSSGAVSSGSSASAPAANGSNVLAYTPKSAFTAWGTWRLPRRVTLGLGARHTGAMQRGHDGAVGTPAYAEAYWVFDAMASYAINRHASLQLNVYNLFDKDYVAAINKSGYRYTPGTPRSALLTLDIRY
jgi:catecholate siderophore receptor